MALKEYAIGVDLGGTKIAAALVGIDGQIETSMKYPTDVDGGPAAVKEQIVELVRHLIDKTGCSPVGVGVGVAGQIKSKNGVVRFAPNLDWHDVPLQSQLESSLDLPVAVTNDVRAITWGEWRFGAGKGCDNLVCMFIGTGIGGGVVTGGKMVAGCSNTAGEIGHIVVDVHGPVCNCGNRGCLEILAGGLAIGKRAQAIARTHAEQAAALLRLVNGRHEDISAETVAKAFHQGDPLAGDVVTEVVEALVAGAVTLVHCFNPCLFILGGGVVDGIPELVALVERKIYQQCLTAATENLKVVKAELADEAGVIGAAALAMEASAD